MGDYTAKRKRARRRLFLGLLLLPSSLWAEGSYPIRQLGMDKGLSNNYVVSIAQDKAGFLWFATEEGLNKFDGTRFITYYKDERGTGSITGNELNCLIDDPSDSILWIGTQRAGLNAYDYAAGTFACYRHDEADPGSLATDDVTKILPSHDGNLWIATYWQGIDYFDKRTRRFVHYNQETVPGLVSNHVWSIAEDGGRHLYIGHANHGFSVLSLKDRTVKNFVHDPASPYSLPGNTVKCVYRDDNGNIWVGSDRGLALFDPDTERFIRFGQVPHDVFDIRQLDDNKLWIAMEFGGIAIMNLSQRLFTLPEQVQFQYIREGDDGYSLSNSSVRCIFQDTFKNVWTGVWGGGINFLSHEPPLFGGYYYSPNPHSPGRLNNKTASSVCVDGRGRLWIGTDGGGINVFRDGVRQTVFPPSEDRNDANSVQTSLRDTDGNLWFGLFYGGVSYYDSKRDIFHADYLPQLEGKDVRSLYEDEQGQLWIGTDGDGIYRTDLGRRQPMKHYPFGNNMVRCILKDSRQRLWIGTFGGGLGVSDDSVSQVRMFDVGNGFLSNTVNHIYEDSHGNVWVATGEGLAHFAPGTNLDFRTYRREAGLANTHIRAIAEDGKGNIWVSTNKGISCLLNGTDGFLNYDHRDNIPTGNFMSGSVAEDESGRIYFGSVGGLCYFSPEAVLAKRQSPEAAITDMKIFTSLGKGGGGEEAVDINGRTRVEMSHRQNSFGITFNVRDYALSDRVEYACMLEGMDELWYPTDGANAATFRNIPPGKYRFLVKTRLRNQAWSDQLTNLDITIVPPLWLTWWAKTGYVLLFALVCLLILYAYKKRIDVEALYRIEKKNHEHEQTRNAERLRFFTNITHELRTPLTLILGPLEDIRKSPTLAERDTQKIAVIHQSAIRLLNLINQILEFRKVETQNKKLCVGRYNLAALVTEVGTKYKELNRKSGVEVEIRAASEEMTLYFDKEAVTIILDNLLSNALKHTERGSVILSVRPTERNGIRHTEIGVSDTGHGIDAAALPHIFERYYQEERDKRVSGTGIGLALVKSLVTLHEGEISVESKPGQGTSFRFTLLTDNTYPHALHADSEVSQPEAEDEGLVATDAMSPPVGGKALLLVVEDDPDISHYICESFADRFEVKSAANGQQGLDLAIHYTPDIIVSDIMMPVMDGISLCRQLKTDVRTSHIPVILLTAKDTPEDKEEGYETGADSYLTKPFSATLLHSRVNNLLEARRKLAERFATSYGPSDNSRLEGKRAQLAESLNQLDREFLEKISALVEERISSERVDVAFLSDRLCMSGSTLYRKIKALTGLSTNEYVRKLKMRHAERLLLEGRYQVSEVAFKVGFNSVVYFRQCFKEEFGVLPSDYLKPST
ncbi:MAG: response regulator [Mediterranea sp.]|nr:response regulator [Mediterranea sp.]